MGARTRKRILRHSRATAPQREFWASDAKFRLYAGGVGAGKTRAGVIEAFRQPRDSMGAILAPTYRMLMDATLVTFLEMARRGGILREWIKSDMTAILGGNRTVLFRSADNPESLRGPNLGWFWPDEAALMEEMVWLIMLGRLRCYPARAWATTTPRGKNWVYKTIVEPHKRGDPRFCAVRASSRTNPYLPRDFVQTLVDGYDPTFARQEIDGEFLDDTLGRLILDWWIDRLTDLVRPGTGGGLRWLTIDLGEGGGRDSTAHMVGDGLGILHAEESPWVGPAQAAAHGVELMRTWDVLEERVVYDAGGGRGLDIRPYFEQHGVTEALPYKGAGTGGPKFANRRSKMGWRVRQRLDPERPKPPPPLKYDPELEERKRSVFYVPPKPRLHMIQPPFCLPKHRPWWPLLAEELKAAYYFHKGKTIALELKEDMKKRIKRSPNLFDCLLMSRILYPDNESETDDE